MIRAGDLYTVSVEQPLLINALPIGTTCIRYVVRAVTDVRNLSVSRSYEVQCTQRIVIPNSNRFIISPSLGPTLFEAYPALISSKINMTLSAPNVPPPELLDYTPRTINTAVMTSANQAVGSNVSTSSQHTSGSSTSQANTYGVSISAGFFGGDPTGGISASYSHSSEHGTDTSNSSGTQSGTDSQSGSSDSMSVKDWAAYASVDEVNKNLTWIWAQEYPWDVIQYRFYDGTHIHLPDFVKDRLYDTNKNRVSPPSQLSLFGIDFTMKASWRIPLADAVVDQSIQFLHSIEYVTATHGLDKSNAFYATLDPAPNRFYPDVPSLDLTLLGLGPILQAAGDNGAVVGFAANKFICPPTNGQAFKIISGANNLQVTGSGFDHAMESTFQHKQTTLIIQFKIIDDTQQYSLFIKHWKKATFGCTLSFLINGDLTNPIVRHVDAKEGEGGENNLLSLSLRNKDYSSIDYHDYLVMGLNTIEVTITPSHAGSSSHYVLRALAIGEE